MKGLLAAALAAGLLATACGGSSSSTTLATATTSPPLTTDTFTGTVAVGGNDVHPFTVAQTGEVDITLTQVGDPPTITMGLGVGAPPAANSLTCIFLINSSTQTPAVTQTQAGSTPQLFGTVSPGTYCVEVYDIGNQMAPVDYTVTVAYPK